MVLLLESWQSQVQVGPRLRYHCRVQIRSPRDRRVKSGRSESFGMCHCLVQIPECLQHVEDGLSAWTFELSNARISWDGKCFSGAYSQCRITVRTSLSPIKAKRATPNLFGADCLCRPQVAAAHHPRGVCVTDRSKQS